jgi:hypothetical protein
MNSRVALITFLDGGGGNYPDNTLPGGPPPTIDNSLPPGFQPVDPGFGVRPPVDPGYGRPVWPNRPDNSLPWSPNRPSNPIALPPVTIDNTLPEGTPPPQVSLPIYLPPPTKPVEPDQKFELKYSIRFGWVIVAVEDETAQPK